jgi:phage terminase small subunit
MGNSSMPDEAPAYNILKIAEKPSKAPRHLSHDMKVWFDSVVATYQMEPHHLRLLQLACEAWDRASDARQEIGEIGMTFIDKHGSPHPVPQVGIERDARIAFARILRELDLDAEPPKSPSQPPSLRSIRRS